MALRAQPAGLVRFAAKSAAQPGKELLHLGSSIHMKYSGSTSPEEVA